MGNLSLQLYVFIQSLSSISIELIILYCSIIQYYFFSNCCHFDHWKIFQLAFVSISCVPTILFFSTCNFLALQDARGSSYLFPAPVLKSDISLITPECGLYLCMHLLKFISCRLSFCVANCIYTSSKSKSVNKVLISRLTFLSGMN